MVRSLVVSLAAAALLFPAICSAETVGILEWVTAGVPKAASDRFEEALEDGLEGANFEVRKRESMEASLKASTYVEGCNFGPCMRKVHEATGVGLAVVARVQGVGSSYTFIVSLVDSKTGHLVAQVSRGCAACSIDDAVLTASLMGPDLLLERVGEAEGSKRKAGIERSRSDEEVRGVADSRRQSLRTTSYLFLGASLAAGALGGYFLYDDDNDKGLPLVAGAGASFLGGVTMLLFSKEF